MNVHIPRWNHDVFAWNFSRAEGVANDVDGALKGRPTRKLRNKHQMHLYSGIIV